MRTRAVSRLGAAGLLAVGAWLSACSNGGDTDPNDDAAATSVSPEVVTAAETSVVDSGDDGAPAERGSATTSPVEPGDGTTVDAGPTTTEHVGSTSQGFSLEGDVEVAAGTRLALGDCPPGWDPLGGIVGNEIRFGQSLPQTGPMSELGAIGDGMRMWFDHVNATDPIDGKEIVLVTDDDGHEPGRAVVNIEQMLDDDEIFAVVGLLSPTAAFAVRPLTREACVPQLFNSSGLPLWGDPASWPWTVGNTLDHVTETEIWCEAIVEERGEGASVAALIIDNEFGRAYEQTLRSCAEEGKIDIVVEQLHDPAAPDVQKEMAAIIGSGADVFAAGTTAAFCPQTVDAVAGSDWRPTFYMSYTCNNLSSLFTPVQDEAGRLADEGSGVRMANSTKICGDPKYVDDPAIRQIEEVLAEYGGVSCTDGLHSTGVLYGQFVTDLLRTTVDTFGELNRVNLMAALWNSDTSNDIMLGGTLRLDGVNDAYWTEAAQIQEVVVADGALTFEPLGDLVDMEGEGGSFDGG